MSFLRDSLDSLDQASQPNNRFYVDVGRDPRRSEYQIGNRDSRRPDHQPGNRAAPPQSQSQREAAEDLSRRERLQRVLARLNRLHEPATSSTSAYTNRTPSPNRQSLYDWAPAYDDNNEQENELDAILSELRQQQPETHPDILRVLGQSPLDGNRQREREASGASGNNDPMDTLTDDLLEQRRSLLRDRERRRRENEWASLRSRAVLQRARQEVGGSPSATERMLRYVMDRERSGMSEEEERARGTGWFRPSPSRGGNGNEEPRSQVHRGENSWISTPPASELRERDRQARVDAFRRGYLAENVPPRLPRISTPPVPASNNAPATPSFLENALKYLSDLRSCKRYNEALSTAIERGMAMREFFAEKHDDFVMDLNELSQLPPSSWLQPGTVFEGHQHANTVGGASLTHQGQTSGPRVEQINPNYRNSNATTTGFDHPPGSTRVVSFDTSNRPSLASPPLLTSPKETHDSWPVRVMIHSIDPEKMTMQGTMEAYDVPQHPSSLSILNSVDRPKAGKKNAPITTYLEGHIIDLRTHSFLTPGAADDRKAGGSSRTGPHSTNPQNSTPYTTIPTNIAFPTATSQTDAQNWLKLSPFSHINPVLSPDGPATHGDIIARILLSKSQLQDLHNEYIFMRWKERCFVHAKNDECSATQAERVGDQDRGHGLTISGFYYVSLRRSDGVVEGLYFDPMSTPYQYLRLSGRTSGWGAWDFR